MTEEDCFHRRGSNPQTSATRGDRLSVRPPRPVTGSAYHDRGAVEDADPGVGVSVAQVMVVVWGDGVTTLYFGGRGPWNVSGDW